jgi:DNA-binding transcriptional MerR regulator
MRVGELAQEAGVRRETIHFYLREGLLPEPEKVNARVAYFGERHLARLRLIKALQGAHLPLAMIRRHLEGTRSLAEMSRLEERLLSERGEQVVAEFFGLDGEEERLSAAAVAEGAGLSAAQLAELERVGVLRPLQGDGGPVYTRAEVEAARAAKAILEQGVAADALRFAGRYTELAEEELGFLFHHVVRPAIAAGRRDQVSATVALRGLHALEAYLRRQHHRQRGLFPADPEPADPLGAGGGGGAV